MALCANSPDRLRAAPLFLIEKATSSSLPYAPSRGSGDDGAKGSPPTAALALLARPRAGEAEGSDGSKT